MHTSVKVGVLYQQTIDAVLGTDKVQLVPNPGAEIPTKLNIRIYFMVLHSVKDFYHKQEFGIKVWKYICIREH